MERAGLQPTGDVLFDRAARSVVAALVLAYPTGRWISYSRRKAFYARTRRYQGLPYSYDRVVQIVDELLAHDLIEEERAHGWSSSEAPDLRDRQQSRMRAKPALVAAFEDASYQHEVVEEIRMRDLDKTLVDYDESTTTARMRKEVRAINTALANVRIDLPAEAVRRGPAHVEIDGRLYRTAPTVSLYRVFSRASWRCNGRLYGWFQSLPKAVRKGMLLDGEACVELDYSAMHAKMLYAKRGAPAPDGFDPYAVPGFGRDVAKACFNVGFNAASRHATIMSLVGRTDKDGDRWPLTKPETAALYDALVERNPMLKDDLGSDAGIYLMPEEAKIALRVVKACIKAGFPCLPIHDGFAVQARHEDALRAIMDAEWERWTASATGKSANTEIPCAVRAARGFGSTYSNPPAAPLSSPSAVSGGYVPVYSPSSPLLDGPEWSGARPGESFSAYRSRINAPSSNRSTGFLERREAQRRLDALRYSSFLSAMARGEKVLHVASDDGERQIAVTVAAMAGEDPEDLLHSMRRDRMREARHNDRLIEAGWRFI